MPAEPWIGFRFPTKQVSWLKRDVLLFANSVGVKADDLHLLYELHVNFQVLPSYPTVLSQKGTNPEVVNFYAEFDKNNAGIPIPGVPKLDVKRMVDAGRTMTFLKPIPPTSQGHQFEQHMKVIGVYDKGKAGTVVQTETVLVDVNTREIYTKVVGNNFYLGQGGWGGSKGPSPALYPPPTRKPDFTYPIATTNETALLYRLNGDSNPLHASPEAGISMGFKGAIIHGLWSYNATLYAILRMIGGSEVANIRIFEAKFASPISPGEKAVAEIWRLGEYDKDGFEEVRFTLTKEGVGSKPVLTNGRALVRPKAGSSKL